MMTKLGSARPTLVWIAVIVALSVWALRDLALLIGYAVLLAYALLPAVGAIERLQFGRGRTLPRGVAAGILMLALVGLVGALLAFAVTRLASQAPHFPPRVPSAATRLLDDPRSWSAAGGPAPPLGPPLPTLPP